MPAGKSLSGLKTLDNVLKAVDVSESYYEGNCRTAREVAAEVFATQKVIGSLMEGARL
jgi:hypothetical protein